MKINNEELKEVLRIVKPGLGDEKAVEQSTSFAFVGNKVVTYNDQISISHPIEGLDLTGAIKAEEFYSLLNKIKKDEIDIEVVDGQVLISAGRVKAGLKLQSEIKLPLETIEEISLIEGKVKWKVIPDGFLQSLSFAAPVCSRDTSRLLLNCIYVGESEIISSDSFRILSQTLSDKLPYKDFLLPASVVRIITQLNPTHIFKKDGWVFFKTETGTIISCRLVEGEYPDISAHFIDSGEEITLTSKITSIIDRARVFSSETMEYDECVTLEMEKGVLFVKAKSEVGWFEEKSKISYKGKKIKFDITPVLFENIFKQTHTFLFDKNKVQFTGENWEYLVMIRG